MQVHNRATHAFEPAVNHSIACIMAVGERGTRNAERWYDFEYKESRAGADDMYSGKNPRPDNEKLKRVVNTTPQNVKDVPTKPQRS